ncbi:hypothetical protein JKP75_01805 [Blastococcus sp. TML/M2B]|uniref:hypothetical protein n=1 Tax=Blastococcus sp. TML/M2B TaxID=2798727 RepID=UPI001909FFA3|nr:hypothetical protein [Blastococcus sp. TML/M2B]MBN1091431.1 hypothetical protein [Blastococcus sp. TML/M2B]
MRVERTEVRPGPATTVFPGAQPARLAPPPMPAAQAQAPVQAPVPAPAPPAPPATTSFPLLPPAEPVEPLAPLPVAPVPPPPSPLDWLVARELLDTPAAPAERPAPPRPEVRPSPRRRRGDDAELPAADALTAERPAPVAGRPRIEDRGGYRIAMPAPVPDAQPAPAPPAGPETSPGSSNRLAEILAENGVSAAGGGRRRRRYREEGDADDVLSRVLGRD